MHLTGNNSVQPGMYFPTGIVSTQAEYRPQELREYPVESRAFPKNAPFGMWVRRSENKHGREKVVPTECVNGLSILDHHPVTIGFCQCNSL